MPARWAPGRTRRAPTIWAFDHWEGLNAYHKSRGLERMYEEIDKGPPSFGIRPGDIVLIDTVFGKLPDHITTAVSFDGRYLTTLGGNQGSGERGVSRSGEAIDLTQNKEKNDVTDYNSTAVDKDGNKIKTAIKGIVKNWRVHGIGRWSIVDYETHVYVTSPTMPTKPASTAQLGKAQRASKK